MIPMGVFFSPTPSILFSSLFFMLRSLREAWISITAGKATASHFYFFSNLKIRNINYSLSDLIDDIIWNLGKQENKM